MLMNAIYHKLKITPELLELSDVNQRNKKFKESALCYAVAVKRKLD